MNFSIPASVNGWFNNVLITAGGTVPIWAPNLAASITWIGFPIDAAIISDLIPWTSNISLISLINIKPFDPISSNLPRNGETS